jgi:hypothetical protein
MEDRDLFKDIMDLTAAKVTTLIRCRERIVVTLKMEL